MSRAWLAGAGQPYVALVQLEPTGAPPSPTDRERAQAVVDAYRTCRSEEDGPLALLEGALPDELRGTLYRNGIVGLDVHGTQQMHPFDGDGMVSRFTFDGRAVHYRNRVVETREVKEERAAGRMLYRAFGTNLPGGFLKNALRMRFKNAANTSVVHHGGRLLALWEGGQPHALDPDSLACRGRFDFGGQLRNPAGGLDAMITPELPFSAHPTIDPADGTLHNFGTLIGRRAELVLYRVDPGGRMVERRFVPLPRASFVHDFVLTPRYRVFFLTPVTFDVARALSGLASPVDSISRDPSQPTEVLLVPRDGGEPIRIEAEPSFTFHWINGFETDDGRVIIDGCRMADFEGGTLDLRDVDVVQHLEVPPPVPTRWVLDLERRIGDRAHAERHPPRAAGRAPRVRDAPVPLRLRHRPAETERPADPQRPRSPGRRERRDAHPRLRPGPAGRADRGAEAGPGRRAGRVDPQRDLRREGGAERAAGARGEGPVYGRAPRAPAPSPAGLPRTVRSGVSGGRRQAP